MVAYSFQKQFVAAVRSGAKLQTIRAPRKDNKHAKPGDAVQLYTAMRRPECELLRESVCVSVQRITIETVAERVQVFDDERETVMVLALTASDFVSRANLDEFAKADGFDDWRSMRDWFKKQHGPRFEGVLIKWAA